ncbi:hypothetical protein FRC14_005632 [Serendipita sp. 396]|nr:hypothetical protein FRC14_005632 [Serendipita sp. 396]KAG8780241.1 hypothetical protein FRC15_009674 [Serendipita sp. 397]KAG8799025.1 hypothetical protein FRC16_005963 [Serendipita sp. 398]KAG8816817.1 hypothetical protein FRC19_011791 [Serendipita sp. 401]KAG8835241.1 hypothetical protein FRC18_000791 [Serendipita sp. 400]KAG8865744.1 hypothetical protein FRC20_009542 [Serendipita sp. 405]KAG9030515.1 hypothetical protein FS842_004369 [Serendipita sp. 407]
MTYRSEMDVGDHYQVLGVSTDASQDEIRRAYHSSLLQHHPDKRIKSSVTAISQDQLPVPVSSTAANENGHTLNVDRIVEAYRVLSDTSSREKYDLSLADRDQNADSRRAIVTGPRPAKVVSLDEFEEVETSNGSVYTHSCRCGGSFLIDEALLEDDVHLLTCDSCSEVIWVGYEAI